MFTQDHWRACSALVADCHADAGMHLEAGAEVPEPHQPRRSLQPHRAERMINLGRL
jgi:hypothetical protein